MPLVSSAVSRPPQGIVAPKPQSIVAANIKKGDKLEIRPGEPVYIFIEPRMGTGTSLQGLNKRSYNAVQDHLLGREDSPFWDNTATPEKETKAMIFAAALAEAIVAS